MAKVEQLSFSLFKFIGHHHIRLDHCIFLHKLAQGHDALLAIEHKEVEERVAALWDEHRLARAQLRWGDRDVIIKRARAEERLDRAA